MSEKTKERVLSVIGVIFLTAVFISSCEARETQGKIQENNLMFKKVGSGIR